MKVATLPTVHVVLVHYRSRGMLLDLVDDLSVQVGVQAVLHVVECGPDGTVEQVVARYPAVHVHLPGQNLGYCGGNNVALRELLRDPGVERVLICNPDVRLPDRRTLAVLADALAERPQAAAVAPVIRTSEQDEVEYLDSVVDLGTARAHHATTHLPALPAGTADVLTLPWVNGACWLMPRDALQQVGLLDERFFLFFEEVDWALRAGAAGRSLHLVTTTAVRHQRSASFGGSSKGAYYYWRNRWLLFAKHAPQERWRGRVVAELARFALTGRHLRSGASGNAALALADVLRGRTGPRPFSP